MIYIGSFLFPCPLHLLPDFLASLPCSALYYNTVFPSLDRRLPYTVVLLILGLAMGVVLHEEVFGDLSALGDSLRKW